MNIGKRSARQNWKVAKGRGRSEGAEVLGGEIHNPAQGLGRGRGLTGRGGREGG